MHFLKIQRTVGFTLVELMVAMGIGMVMLAAVTTTFMSQTRFYSAQEQINEMEQSARGVLDIMAREIKMAGYDPTVVGFAEISTFTSSQLTVQADLDGSGDITNSITANEQIAYAYDSANKRITRAVGNGSAEVLADNIDSFDFTYYEADGVTTATTSTEIRQVKVNITAKTAKPDPNYTSNGGYKTYNLSTTITPINLAL